MRIRSILPKFYDSEDVGHMDWDTRLVFIGLWSYVDDNGVGRDSVALIASDLFPFDMERDAPETLARVSRALQALSEGGQILRFDEGQRLIFVVRWDQYQRVDKPSKNPRYPRPTRDYGEARESVASGSGESRDTLAPGEGEKGRRGEEEKTPSSTEDGPTLEKKQRAKNTYTDQFEQWWSIYPYRKGSKFNASKEFAKASQLVDLSVLIRATHAYARLGKDRQFVLDGERWLKGRRWEDAPVIPINSNEGYPDQPVIIDGPPPEMQREGGLLD